ncbi:hypothetical protein ACRPH4_22775 (plasmid) [Pantoea allii]|uniref:hypothetical protein n=1 Tax=Pantoea allii TaxID=574096 RepID=UPI003D7A25A5
MTADRTPAYEDSCQHGLNVTLTDIQTVTPALAENLGRVFYSPGFWMVRQAMSELKKLSEDS